MQAVIFSGIPASGKSLYYRRHFATSHVRINLDTLGTRRLEAELLDECLQSRRPFVVDNTNPTPADRRRYLDPAMEAGFTVAGYYFMSTPRASIARSLARTGADVVPPWAVHRSYKKLQPPGASEGFHELTVVRLMPDGTFSTVRIHP
jgi:predicted kinase